MTLTGYDAAAVRRDGFAIVENVADSATVAVLLDELAAVDGPGAIRRRGSVHAVRNLLEAVPAVRDLARSAAARALVEPVLGAECFAVRGILFDKTPDANWKVAWHQDLTIAVRERREVPGFGPWSEKAGITHVQPPAEVLRDMLTVRVHLDPCGTENGPVQVIGGSHLHGRLSPEEIDEWRDGNDAVPCTSPIGGALVMRPLLLHASSASTVPDHRRVVHLEFAAGDLPGGLEWHGRC
ncbi:phytanoyl-CoA dioxygenase family protein [Longimicrobium terrae]|uniref:Ectoine hydroxylase-related dioxygenase (Phytanoyl-CoA dioxygenase family) n=1 Tax=Longimicrobium terrae TaxID=1639882 RepID=A0A841H652_9BACT|nr:phytanoyl-CoA dioxygenase family protein [Longimicrobium terrae]MBB4639163.1 ectoine hydroxylase-related dioxygenase (phytanoyl-CoA dioxygenase family) [Longimicrobium terrae]MBB6073433.1 ectoine hydroxylase-related dioxygenase (phytanoyl-CoA dioxygenase family) [Longimicrobium terrae]NNC32579.1 phytanoyl-CoA dioxygenase [Longimicrobium terrae]